MDTEAPDGAAFMCDGSPDGRAAAAARAACKAATAACCSGSCWDRAAAVANPPDIAVRIGGRTQGEAVVGPGGAVIGGCAVDGPKAVAADRGATPGRTPVPVGVDPIVEEPCTATGGPRSQGASAASPGRGLRERPSSRRPLLLSIFRPLPSPWRSPDIGGRLGGGAHTRGLSHKHAAETAPKRVSACQRASRSSSFARTEWQPPFSLP